MLTKAWTFPGYKAVILLAFLYSLGEMMQRFEAGPLWVRWHLSDFGFPFIFVLWMRLFLRIHPAYCLLVGGAFATMTEVVQFYFGHGDPIDVAVYIAAVFIGFLLVSGKEHEYAPEGVIQT